MITQYIGLVPPQQNVVSLIASCEKDGCRKNISKQYDLQQCTPDTIFTFFNINLIKDIFFYFPIWFPVLEYDPCNLCHACLSRRQGKSKMQLGRNQHFIFTPTCVSYSYYSS